MSSLFTILVKLFTFLEYSFIYTKADFDIAKAIFNSIHSITHKPICNMFSNKNLILTIYDDRGIDVSLTLALGN